MERQWWMCRLCTYKEAPEWSVHNKYIHTGYRTNFTFRDAFRSVLMVHNETANIWTHLLGVGLFACIAIHMAAGWGKTHLAALPESWVVGADHARARVVARVVQSRHALRKTVDGLGSIAKRLRETEHEILGAATSALISVSSAMRDRLHDGLVPEFTKEVLGKTLADAEDSLRLLTRSLRDEVTKDSRRLARTLDGLVRRLERHASELGQTLDDAVVGSDWQTPLALPNDPAPRWPMYVFLFGALCCLSFSAACHTFACVGARVSTAAWRVDYVGIAALIVASFFPVVYYSFYCAPLLRDGYLTIMSFLGIATLTVTLSDSFQDARYSPLRASLFSCLGGCGAVPILHQSWFVWTRKPTPIAVTLWLESLMGACYLSGAVIYAKAVPEKWKPGKFDLWFSSHNIFHVLVVMGAYVHYRAALVLLAWRDHHGCEADVTMLRSWYVTGGTLGEWLPWGFIGGKTREAT